MGHELIDAARALGDPSAVAPAVVAHVGPTPIDVGSAIAWVEDPSCGAVLTFVGVPRADVAPVGVGSVVGLQYEAYERGAYDELVRLAAAAGLRWGIRRLWVAHRTGVVRIGEAALVVVLSSPHRGEALAAMDWLVSQIKARVPIWKQELVEKDVL